MTMAPTAKVILGTTAFVVFWVLAVFPAVPFLPVGRTAGSLLGAVLMVLFQVLTPDRAYAALDLPILGLLFGTMVVSVYLERADMFKHLGKLLSYRNRGPKDLLCRVCLVSAVSSAFFTNDTSCVVLTEFVLKLARQQNLPPRPFLLALASSANIGSSATPIGNPQNLVIAVQSGISFGNFLFGIFPAMIVGVVINASILLCMHWKALSEGKDEENGKSLVDVLDEEEVVCHRFTPATLSHQNLVVGSEEIFGAAEGSGGGAHLNGHMNHFPSSVLRSRSTSNNEGIEDRNVGGSSRRLEEGAATPQRSSSANDYGGFFGFGAAVERLGLSKKWKRVLWKSCVYLVTLGMLVALLAGMNMSWSAITAALALVVLDFKDAGPCLEKVSYSLLVFFCGMFVTVDGFNKTGIPSAMWDLMQPYAKINQVGGTIVLAIVILVLSNIASNVPTVLLLGARVAASALAISPAHEKKAWLVLAWVSTVAGNLSLLGSAANLIVCEQARRAQHDNGYNLTFWSHLKFGFPSTLVVTAVGLTLIRG